MTIEQQRQDINNINFDSLIRNETNEWIKEQLIEMYFDFEKMKMERQNMTAQQLSIKAEDFYKKELYLLKKGNPDLK